MYSYKKLSLLLSTTLLIAICGKAQANAPDGSNNAVGKQVRWLQYYLEQQNAGEYYFMEGGAAAFYKIPTEKLLDK